jgi:hypothetical protein
MQLAVAPGRERAAGGVGHHGDGHRGVALLPGVRIGVEASQY